MDTTGIIIFSLGVFSIAGGVFNWDWFMNNRRARRFVNLIGRNSARIFYCILGAAFAILGALVTFGIVDMSQ